MNDVIDDFGTLMPGQSRPAHRHTKAIELGPYPFRTRVDLTAVSRHNGGGDSSRAWMKLFYDGAQVGEAADHHFNNADLAVTYTVELDPPNTAAFRIESGNEGATEWDYGFDLIVYRV